MQLPTLLCIKVQSLKMQLYMGFLLYTPKTLGKFLGAEIYVKKFKRREKEMQLPSLLCLKVQILKMQQYMGFCYIHTYAQNIWAIFGGRKL